MKSLNRISAIIVKEVLQLKRDRLTFGMVIMIPLIQLLLFGFAINTKIRDIPVGVLDYEKSALSRVLVQMATATQTVKFATQFTTIEEAQAAISREQVRAVLIIPKDLAGRLVRHSSLGFGTPASTTQETSRPIAQWLVDGSDTMIAATIRGLANMPLKELTGKAANRYTPTFETTLLYNPEQRSAVNIIPGLVAIILTMTMIMFTSAAIVRERERGNLELIIATPIHSLELMLGKITPYIFIGIVQVCIILGLGYSIFNVPFNGALTDLAIATVLFIAATLSLGLVISTVAKSQLQSMQLTVFILLPSILLSGFMFPFEGMPKAAQYLAEILPATHFMRIVRGIILRGTDIYNLLPEVLWLLGFTLAFLSIATVRFKSHLN